MGNSGCPVCEGSVQVDDKPTQDWLQFACPRCGTFQMTWEAIDLAGPLVRREVGKAMAVSHVIRRMGDAGVPRMTSALLTQIAETARLPSLPEAAEATVRASTQSSRSHRNPYKAESALRV